MRIFELMDSDNNQLTSFEINSIDFNMRAWSQRPWLLPHTSPPRAIHNLLRNNVSLEVRDKRESRFFIQPEPA